ncbi:hypothetical protein BDR04DRAFT_1123450 [Suillus decipiens]|nr:hypothetical protein BDR04DRAFT_1123450 [Suillus decipiens]
MLHGNMANLSLLLFSAYIRYLNLNSCKFYLFVHPLLLMEMILFSKIHHMLLLIMSTVGLKIIPNFTLKLHTFIVFMLSMTLMFAIKKLSEVQKFRSSEVEMEGGWGHWNQHSNGASENASVQVLMSTISPSSGSLSM